MNHKNILFKIISAPFILLGVIGGMDTIINMLNPKVRLKKRLEIICESRN